MSEVWVFADRPGGVTLELLAAARSAGGPASGGPAAGGTVVVFGASEMVLPAAAELGRHGAHRVVAVEGVGDRLPAGPVASAVAGAAGGASLVLLPATYDGRDVAGRLSARLGRPVVGNAVGIPAAGVVETAIFGGTTLVRTRFTGPPPWLVTVKPRAFEAEAIGGTSTPEVVAVQAPAATPAPVVVERHAEPGRGPDLDGAAVVVAGGRGLGSAGAFEQVAELAGLLGGAPAASRAVVDAGWVPYAWQVGQTGRSVAPALYLALGISGAAQHLVGMSGARTVVAVNTDRAAPIFGVADLGVVGDAADVLARLIQAVRERRSREGR